jgi:hypothetical protein
MVAVPALTAFHVPVELPMVAIAVLSLVQEPPVGVLLRVAEAPWQSTCVPEIAVGCVLMVIVVVVIQPEPSE